MGRHSSTSQFHYYRSVVAWFLPWVLVASVVGAGVWVGVDMLGGDDIADPSSPIAAASQSPTPEETETAPTPVETATAEPTPKRSKEPPNKQGSQPKLITEDITVQVLNATTNDPDADDQMADKLAGVGFEVIAVGGANRVYQRTTVLWSFNESKKAAERLAARFGWSVAAKPSNLSTTVDIHVVVGEDFSG